MTLRENKVARDFEVLAYNALTHDWQNINAIASTIGKNTMFTASALRRLATRRQIDVDEAPLIRYRLKDGASPKIAVDNERHLDRTSVRADASLKVDQGENAASAASNTACPHCGREIDPDHWVRIGCRLTGYMRGNLKSKQIDLCCPHCKSKIDKSIWIARGPALAIGRRKSNPSAFAPHASTCPHCLSDRPSKLELRYVHLPTCEKNPHRREPGATVINGKPCRWCSQIKGRMELRYHEPRCDKNPNPKEN